VKNFVPSFCCFTFLLMCNVEKKSAIKCLIATQDCLYRVCRCLLCERCLGCVLFAEGLRSWRSEVSEKQHSVALRLLPLVHVETAEFLLWSAKDPRKGQATADAS
jgi:hypothetical protein